MIRRQNEILEICLERLAQGDTVENILADYAQQADELRPLLQAAQQVHSLPSQQPGAAADRRIEQHLRRAVRHRDQAVVERGQRPFSLEVVMRSMLRLVPRVALAVVVVGLIVFLIAQLPFWREPEVEPMVSSTAIAVVGNESNGQVALDLSADPGEVPLYRIVTRPVPDTPKAMLAWARDFGLPDPALYERPTYDDPARYAIGSDGRRLIFQSAGATGEIFYTDPQALTTGEPLPFAEASQIAVAFLRDHNLLPDAYQVGEPMFQGAPGTGQQTVVIRVAVGEGMIGELNNFGTTMNVMVAANGQVASAFLRQVAVEAADTVPVISAQEAYDKLLAGESIGSSRGEIASLNQMGTAYTSPANWQVGQTVDVAGYVELLVGVADDNVKVTLSNANSTIFELTGSRVAELAAETWLQAYRVQGIVTKQLSPSAWEVEVQAWQPVSFEDIGCLIGELVRQDDVVRFRTDEGNEYGLPQAPAEIAAGERLQVCLNLPGEPGSDLNWSMIHLPPVSEQVFSGGGGGGVMAQEVAVEVTRVVGSDGVELEEATAEAPFIEPENPYHMGDSVEMIGYVQGVRLVDDAGSSRLELQLVNDAGQGEAAYPLNYPLLAPVELLEEMAAFADLHIRVRGEIVPAPENTMYPSLQGQAIAVESFDRPWPEEKLENFLGHFAVEEIEGQQRLVFTDHATDQRYVVDPQYSVMVDERDVRLHEEQGLLTAVINPAVEPIGGLPVMLNRGFATGPEIALATDASQFPLPTENRIGTINEAYLRGNEIDEHDLIERVELVYPYDPFANQSAMEGQPVEPVWLFYGRNSQGTLFFTMTVRAVE